MIVWANGIWFEHIDVQFLTVHWVVVANDWLQLISITETIKKSWFRRYCIGDDNVDVSGIGMTVGGRHAKMIENFYFCLFSLEKKQNNLFQYILQEFVAKINFWIRLLPWSVTNILP